MDKAAFGLTLLRGHSSARTLPRELELLRLCNELAGGQVPEAFPGAQPTSLTRRKVEEHLLREPYLVCEKTDGERHLLLAYEGSVFLIDRKSQVWLCPLQLPLPSGHARAPGWHHKTLLDGELVLDEEKGGTEHHLRYLVYDTIAICGEILTHWTLLHRLRRCLLDVVHPKEQLVAAVSGKVSAREPVQVFLKDFFETWQLGKVIRMAEELPHKCDGLVFTPVMVPYSPGTCPALLKWKPSHMNTVDFLLQVVKGHGRHVHVKLLVGMKKGEEWVVKFNGHWLAKSGPAFKALLADPNAAHGRIGECRWQPTAKTFRPQDAFYFTIDGTWEDGGWVLQKIRDDKKLPNDMRTAKRVVESIDDNLTLECLEEQVVAAHVKGELPVAANCGEGELPRALVELKPGWAKPEDAYHPRVEVSQIKAKSGKAKGRGGKGLADRTKASAADVSLASAMPSTPPVGVPLQQPELAGGSPKGGAGHRAARGGGRGGGPGCGKQHRSTDRVVGGSGKRLRADDKAVESDAKLVRWSAGLVGDDAAPASVAIFDEPLSGAGSAVAQRAATVAADAPLAPHVAALTRAAAAAEEEQEDKVMMEDDSQEAAALVPAAPVEGRRRAKGRGRAPNRRVLGRGPGDLPGEVGGGAQTAAAGSCATAPPLSTSAAEEEQDDEVMMEVDSQEACPPQEAAAQLPVAAARGRRRASGRGRNPGRSGRGRGAMGAEEVGRGAAESAAQQATSRVASADIAAAAALARVGTLLKRRQGSSRAGADAIAAGRFARFVQAGEAAGLMDDEGSSGIANLSAPKTPTQELDANSEADAPSESEVHLFGDE